MRRNINQPDDMRIVFGDGHFDIDWLNIPVGGSFFLPLVRPHLIIKQVNDICRWAHLRFVYQERIEKGLYGIRFWRVDTG